MPRTKSDTIEAMGLEGFLNKRYAKKGGYSQYVEMVTAGEQDKAIAIEFGEEGQPLHYQAVANWRKAYLRERER